MCTKCQSTKFKAKNVSADFLKKLKIKPGIGRPRRYPIPFSRSPSPSSSELEVNKDETVTVEKLFQLPSERLQEIFEGTASKRKLVQNGGIPPTCRRCHTRSSSWRFDNIDSCEWMLKKPSKPTMKEISSNTSMCSRKPLNCPHKPCNKIIAMSSFHTHFKHEHTDIPRYSLDRGNELEIQVDLSLLEYNTTFCLGMVTLYETSMLSVSKTCSTPAANVAKKFSQRLPVDTFWIMVSGSNESKKSHAYIIFWLFTNNDQFYNCTLELASNKDIMCYSTFCSINYMHDSHAIKDVSERLNCLYVTYGAMESILTHGLKPKFRVTIH